MRILAYAETGCSAENIKLHEQTEDDRDMVIFCFCIDTQPNFLSQNRSGIGQAFRPTGKNAEQYSRIGIAYNMPLP